MLYDESLQESRMRENRTYGLTRGLRNEEIPCSVLYSTAFVAKFSAIKYKKEKEMALKIHGSPT